MARLTQRLGLTRFEADEYYKKAIIAYNKRNGDEAILNMELAIELLPTNAEYYAARGFFYLQDGIKDKAQVDFEQALKIYPYEMMAHFGRGIIAYEDKNWDEALAHFNDAYRSDPKRAETLYYLALTHHRKSENVQALAFMRLADAGFDVNKDKRKRNTERWIKTLESLVAQGQ